MSCPKKKTPYGVFFFRVAHRPFSGCPSLDFFSRPRFKNQESNRSRLQESTIKLFYIPPSGPAQEITAAADVAGVDVEARLTEVADADAPTSKSAT